MYMNASFIVLVFTAAGVKVAAFCLVAHCGLPEFHQRFSGTNCKYCTFVPSTGSGILSRKSPLWQPYIYFLS